MPRMTAEERAELEAKLRADDEDDDDEYELGFSDGSYVRGRHSRISKIAAARGVKLEADPETSDGDGKTGKRSDDGKVVPAHFRGGSRRSS